MINGKQKIGNGKSNMGGNEELRKRFYDFALEIVKFVRKLPKEMAAYEIGKQLINSGPSIAANYEEATGAFSKKDFTYKLSIAFKEAKKLIFGLDYIGILILPQVKILGNWFRNLGR
mgnify:CR=1 FL=1